VVSIQVVRAHVRFGWVMVFELTEFLLAPVSPQRLYRPKPNCLKDNATKATTRGGEDIDYSERTPHPHFFLLGSCKVSSSSSPISFLLPSTWLPCCTFNLLLVPCLLLVSHPIPVTDSYITALWCLFELVV